jgi:hypothetical protein
MNGHCQKQFFDEFLPLCFSLGCIRTGRAVRELDQRNNRDGDFSFCDFTGDGSKGLPGVLTLPLGDDEYARLLGRGSRRRHPISKRSSGG